MSYILEALKKAQAERQLGETPTIHAPTLETGVPREGRGTRLPLAAAVGVMGAVIAGLVVVLWHQAGQPEGAAAAAPALTPAPVAAVPAPAVVAAPVPAPAPMAAVPTPAPVTAGAAPTPAPVAAAATAPIPVVATVAAAPAMPQPAAQSGTPPVDVKPVPVPARQPAAAAEAKPVERPQEEPVQALRDLPEPIQRAIPPVAMSGYMYSPNPADRMILIDKVLRREGDEVAPGLVLAKLEPKGAVFTFRGYRYRMPY